MSVTLIQNVELHESLEMESALLIFNAEQAPGWFEACQRLVLDFRPDQVTFYDPDRWEKGELAAMVFPHIPAEGKAHLKSLAGLAVASQTQNGELTVVPVWGAPMDDLIALGKSTPAA